MLKKTGKFVIAIVLIGAVYLLFSVSQIYFSDSSDFDLAKTDFKIIAHRGAADIAPGNTLASVKKALEVHPDCIEIDIHQTKDEKLVLMHDLSVDRTTNGTGLIKDKNYSEISKLDAGSWFSKDYAGEKIPTLEEVLQLIDGKSELIIEIKKGDDYYPNIIRNLVSLIKKYNAEDWCIIHSFNTQALKDVHKINPKLRLNKIFIGKLAFVPVIISEDEQIEFYDIDDYPYISAYNINYNFANRRLIDLLHEKGKKVNVWSVDDIDDLTGLVSLGVDGIITDNPSITKQ